jgi:para-aminobenzoate synthetase/4-amino-4-deoxychorismate lyase
MSDWGNSLDACPVVRLDSFHRRSPLWSGVFRQPVSTASAATPAEVNSLLCQAQAAAAAGRWVILVITYEAAPAFESALMPKPKSQADFPVAWMAVFDERAENMNAPPNTDYSVSAWTAKVARSDYEQGISRIHEYIRAGDTYQVNYTFPLTAEVHGDCLRWYHDLCRAQQADYCAFVDMGRFKLLSASPELFFEVSNGVIRTRPMKGTMSRGRWLEEDRQRTKDLACCTKNRAENVMIVDLLRNDLGRVCQPGTVRTARLFEVEKLRSVLQMTSTIEGQIKTGVGLPELFKALFPCGSITGAPKIRTMEIIDELEPHARGIYTGTIGMLAPNGDAVFNVAIRTVVVDSQTGQATFGVGGGITSDSTQAGEYEECQLKAAFLAHPPGEPDLLESLLLDNGCFFLLERHMQRLQDSAEYFGMAIDLPAVRRRLLALRDTHARGCWKVRLLVNREGVSVCEAQALDAPAGMPVWRVAVAEEPVNSQDQFLFHKTARRTVYDAALAARRDCRDVILWNEKGEVTESCYANVVVTENGVNWTPPRACGLLAGTFRAELLERGVLRERIIRKEDLLAAEQVYLVNSVRKWIRAEIA